ncbi:MAG: hypothetical protein HYU47_04890 [Deltaproteobacteria bacterium]|nr:hypothetical protein [Deltaproteobacteria bacterium]MBI2209923.1 hypothetical protein [Deltaproteobacteria bacterium]MBI2540161.1 hypothetical protein [Deltaproteobacteria bacterium]MBI3061399.1 hypothetical protein [Deltaproteobacteria bacterium]
MKKILAVILCLLFWSAPLGAEPSRETVISREEADRLFSLIRPEWEKAARGSYYPGWAIQLSPRDTGMSLKAYDPSQKFSVSVQPFYDDDMSPPKSLIVGASYPVDFWTGGTDQMLSNIRSANRRSLGPSYSVSLVHQRVNRLDVIELFITKRLGP